MSSEIHNLTSGHFGHGACLKEKAVVTNITHHTMMYRVLFRGIHFCMVILSSLGTYTASADKRVIFLKN